MSDYHMDYRTYLDDDDDEKTRAATAKAATSGGIGSALMTGGSALLGGQRDIKTLLRRAAVGGLGGAALAGGATYLGSKLLGSPEENDPGAYTRRGGIGGAVGGGLVGGGLGYLMGTGKLQKLGALLGKSELGAILGHAAKEELPLDNLVMDKLKAWAGTKHGGLKAGALLGAGTGAVAGSMGASEGMEQDFLQNEIAAARRRKAVEEAMNERT